MDIQTKISPYSSEQAVTYLKKIGYNLQDSDLTSVVPNLENLITIFQLHLIAFPFENLSPHYSAGHTLEVSTNAVFERMVISDRGFGHYCFGHNTLLLGMLQRLNYRAYAGGARSNMSHVDSESPTFTTLVHMVLFAIPSDVNDQPHLVDVGFGGVFGMSGLVRPIPLTADLVHPGSAPPEEHRLVRGRLPNSSVEGHQEPDWFLQARCGRPTWRSLYSFTTTEYFPEDFAAWSFFINHGPFGPMQTLVICIKVFKTNEGHLGRCLVVGDRITRRVGEKSEVVKTFDSESERISAFKEFCGLDLEADAEAIMKGRQAALQP